MDDARLTSLAAQWPATVAEQVEFLRTVQREAFAAGVSAIRAFASEHFGEAFDGLSSLQNRIASVKAHCLDGFPGFGPDD